MSETAVLSVSGPFSLRGAAEFGFGPNEGRPAEFDGAMRLAFPVDGGQGYAGAVLRRDDPEGPVTVELELRDGAPREVALAQVARIVSLDHDGDDFMAVGRGDPVLGALQRALPGQRPVLFVSPYEAAAWSVISARRASAQAARVREDLARQLGETFTLAGQELPAFPQPRHLLELGDRFPGLSLQKLVRLRDVAGAALDGALDVAHLHALGPEQAQLEVQRLPGIGPFYAGLIVVRGAGFADAVLLSAEPRLLGHVAHYYGLDAPPDVAAFTALAERWRPFRTWAAVLIRVAGGRWVTI